MYIRRYLMDFENLLKNKPVPVKHKELFESEISENEIPLFIIVSDLDQKGDYSEPSILFTDKSLITVSDEFERHIAYDDITEIKVKRMYGNGLMNVSLSNGENNVTILRFTFLIAELCDACAEFVNKIKAGSDITECRNSVEAVYKNRNRTCPKCGATLSSPTAPCKYCSKGNGAISILAKYMKPYLPLLIGTIILSCITTFASLVPPYITSRLVDKIIPDKDLRMLGIIVLALLGVYLIQIGVGAIRNYLLRIAGIGIIGDLKKDIYAKAQFLPMRFYDKTSTGGVINRVNSDTTVLKSFMMTISQDAVVQFFTMIGIIIIMFVMNWQLTLMSLITVPFVALISRQLGKLIAPKYIRLWKRNATISGMLSDTLPAIRIVKSFTGENSTIDKFNGNVDNMVEEDKKIGRIAVTFPALITFLMMCGTSIIWYVGGRMVIGEVDGFTLGLLVSYISYTSMFYNPINFFAGLSDSYRNAAASAEKIFDIVRAEPEHDFGAGNELEMMNGKIEFRGVNFSFDRTKKVLDNVNFVINPGDVVGIVGTTGSGKTTLINLLMRFYDDYEGEILVDDVNIKDIDMAYYRRQIGYVQQEPIMFRDTIFNNIAYSKPDATVEEVINVADIANAHGFISKLPDAYDTVLGERGSGLSGGEKQRLSIARAVLRNPAILIFDEATSAVDSETEKQIQDAIDNITSGRTTLMIAHRLSTLRKANKIIVVDAGKIIEFGTPEELLAMKGKYYKLVNIQTMSEQANAAKAAERFDM